MSENTKVSDSSIRQLNAAEVNQVAGGTSYVSISDDCCKNARVTEEQTDTGTSWRVDCD